MRLAYRDRVGGPWRVWNRHNINTPIIDQYEDMRGLGNIIIGTCRGRTIKRRAIRGL